MANSLREQLLKTGIVKQLREAKRSSPSVPDADKRTVTLAGNKVSSTKKTSAVREGSSLAKAYAMRSQAEICEHREAERKAVEEAQRKRACKQKLKRLLKGRVLNEADAEHVRHFEYRGKIRRIYVNAQQLTAINAGELGVVQQNGYYMLVERAVAEQVREMDARRLALLMEPVQRSGVDEDGIPDDLIW